MAFHEGWSREELEEALEASQQAEALLREQLSEAREGWEAAAAQGQMDAEQLELAEDALRAAQNELARLQVQLACCLQERGIWENKAIRAEARLMACQSGLGWLLQQPGEQAQLLALEARKKAQDERERDEEGQGQGGCC